MFFHFSTSVRLVLWLSSLCFVSAIDIDWSNPDSVKAGARTVAYDLLSFYKGNLTGNIPGLLPGPYFWWEAGAMFGSLVDYYHYTNDSTYNNLTITALQYQVGPHQDYMPPEQAASLGNDDQAFWGMAALRAAETNFPNPEKGLPSWLSLAQAVFNEQVGRWDEKTCGGGIRWQIYPIRGFDLKNTISNGCLFNLAARLARYTGDDKYAQWAIKIWNWLSDIGLMDSNYNVYDNTEAPKTNCTTIDKKQFTYNAGTMLMGASTLYNYTNGSALWQERTQGLLNTIAFDYFPNGTMKDICEEHTACNVDQRSFKAYLSRWMAASTQMAPFTYNITKPLLLSSAKAAAKQCTGGASGTMCGLKWYLDGKWDGTTGVGEQMAALETILGTLVGEPSVKAPVTGNTGGTSPSNPTAGNNRSSTPPGIDVDPVGRGEKAGAWILTLIFGACAIGIFAFVSTDSLEEGEGTGTTVAGMWKNTWKGKGKEKGKEEPEIVVSDVDLQDLAPVGAPGEGRSRTRSFSLLGNGPAYKPSVMVERTNVPATRHADLEA